MESYSAQVEEVTTALMDAVSAVGGLLAVDSGRSPLARLPKVTASLSDHPSEIDVREAIADVVVGAALEIDEPHKIRIGRGFKTVSASAEQACESILILLNLPPRIEIPGVRRSKVMGILGLPNDVKTFRYPGGGPQVDLMTILAHRLLVESGLVPPVLIEEIEIEYRISAPTGPKRWQYSQLVKADVRCRARVFRPKHEIFLDCASYLPKWDSLPWPTQPGFSRLESYPDISISRFIPPSFCQANFGCSTDVAFLEERNPRLLVDVASVPLRGEFNYGYTVYYPLCKRTTEGNHYLMAASEESIDRVNLRVTLAGCQEFARQMEWRREDSHDLDMGLMDSKDGEVYEVELSSIRGDEEFGLALNLQWLGFGEEDAKIAEPSSP